MQDICTNLRADGYAPIVLCTLQADGTDLVGSTWDTRRLALNASITGSAGVADVIVDLTTATGIAATNTPTTGQAYTFPAGTRFQQGSDGDYHFTTLGNGYVAQAILAAIKAWSGAAPYQTQRPPAVDRFQQIYDTRAPWTSRVVRFNQVNVDFFDVSSGGGIYAGEGPFGDFMIHNGATAGNYALTHVLVEFLRATKSYWNSGTFAASDPAAFDWGHPWFDVLCLPTEFWSGCLHPHDLPN